MATPTETGMYIHPIDVRDSAKLTRIIDRKVPEVDHYDVPFMPLNGTNKRKVKVRVRIGRGAGLAAFKADNASTPIVELEGDIQEIFMELVVIAEKAVLNQSDIVHLRSVDEGVAMEAAGNIIDKGALLRLRNVNRTRWMAWQAAMGSCSITYPNGTSLTLDFDFAGEVQNTFFSSTHVVTASTLWNATDDDSHYSTNIIDDVYTWSKLIADDLGCNESDVTLHLNSTTWRYVKRNEWLLRESSPSFSQPRTAPLKLAEAAEVLDVKEIKILNPFYLSEDTTMTKTKLLADHTILFTGPYQWQGQPIAEMLDGPVARVSGEEIVVGTNPGMQAEIYLSKEQVAENIRIQTARLPVINFPAAFLKATVAS